MYVNYLEKGLAKSFADVFEKAGWTDMHFSESRAAVLRGARWRRHARRRSNVPTVLALGISATSEFGHGALKRGRSGIRKPLRIAGRRRGRRDERGCQRSPMVDPTLSFMSGFPTQERNWEKEAAN